MAENRTGRLQRIGLFGTGLYIAALGAGVPLMARLGWMEIAPFQFNQLGDFLAGVFGPLAVYWLILGFLQQGEELRQSVRAMELQAEEMRASADAQRKMLEAQRDAIEFEKSRAFANEAAREHEVSPRLMIDVLPVRGPGHGPGNGAGQTGSQGAAVTSGEPASIPAPTPAHTLAPGPAPEPPGYRLRIGNYGAPVYRVSVTVEIGGRRVFSRQDAKFDRGEIWRSESKSLEKEFLAARAAETAITVSYLREDNREVTQKYRLVYNPEDKTFFSQRLEA